MKSQLNIRISDLTKKQLETLMEKWGTSQTETISLLVQGAYIQEIEQVQAAGQSPPQRKESTMNCTAFTHLDNGTIITDERRIHSVNPLGLTQLIAVGKTAAVGLYYAKHSEIDGLVKQLIQDGWENVTYSVQTDGIELLPDNN